MFLSKLYFWKRFPKWTWELGSLYSRAEICLFLIKWWFWMARLKGFPSSYARQFFKAPIILHVLIVPFEFAVFFKIYYCLRISQPLKVRLSLKRLFHKICIIVANTFEMKMCIWLLNQKNCESITEVILPWTKNFLLQVFIISW